MSKRMIFHRAAARISVGVNISDEGIVTAAVAACHPSDQFRRRIANVKLNGRLDGRSEPIGVYDGSTPGEDVYGPIRDVVRSLSKRRNVDSLVNKFREAIHQKQLAW